MSNVFHKLLLYSYCILFFLVPLVMWPYNSELFEFNKMIVVYIFTLVIGGGWVSKMIVEKKIIFRRTVLDIPILVFLGSMFISTIFSIDFRASLLGYYSRFNGGFLSLLCYSVLYWGIVSNLDKKNVFTIIYVNMVSGFIASIYGIAEHFGIDKDIWVQDVQNRVFSTFGQPNWMAAWLVAFIPVSLAVGLSFFESDQKPKKYGVLKLFLFLTIPAVFFTALLFTKSRSGILALFVSLPIFWGLCIFKSLISQRNPKELVKYIILGNLSFLIIILLIGTPWTPKLSDLIKRTTPQAVVQSNEQKVEGPLLEIGGSKSTEIRKIVWKGALELWKKYPVFGTGLETFAFSYYETRIVEHNTVSEWDFLYNKAHNEYLNFMGTTGTIGIISYVSFLLFALFVSICGGRVCIKNLKQTKVKNHIFNIFFHDNNDMLRFAFFSGISSILITNFFGFSVVPVNLLLFTFPALSYVLTRDGVCNEQISVKAANKNLRVPLSIVWVIVLYFTVKTINYWRADIFYSDADKYNSVQNIQNAYEAIEKAIKLSPREAIYYDEKSTTLAAVALLFHQSEEFERARQMAAQAMEVSSKALRLSPRNINIQRNRAKVAVSLSVIDPIYAKEAQNVLVNAVKNAPTEAKLIYNLGLIYFNNQETEKAIETLKYAAEIKPNYIEPHLALSMIYEEIDQIDNAIAELEHVLKNIDPTNSKAKEEIKRLSQKTSQQDLPVTSDE